MKSVLVSLFCIAILSCKETPKEIKTESEAPEITMKIDDSKYPEAMRKVLDAHGGLTNWRSKRVLSFEILKEDVTEMHTIDLRTRSEKIEMGPITMGYDGDAYRLLDKAGSYSGDPIFYHNLMFYFYSMPFVLSDNGINYSETEALKFEGNSYPGIRISFNSGVGASPKDEYFLHYNPETFQMEWLGYTVTYRTGEKSEKISWIRYNDWMPVDNVVLPKSMTWFAVEEGQLKEPRNTRTFENVTLSETVRSSGFFSQPEGSKIVTAKE